MHTLGYLGSVLNPRVETLRDEERLPQTSVSLEVCTPEITPIRLLRDLVMNRIKASNPNYVPSATNTDIGWVDWSAQLDQYWLANVYPVEEGENPDFGVNIWACENSKMIEGDVSDSLSIHLDRVEDIGSRILRPDEVYGLYVDFALAQTAQL